MPFETPVIAAVPAVLNFAVKSAQTGYELKQVPNETRELFSSIASVRDDILKAKEKRVALAKFCTENDLANWDRSIREAESALLNLERLVEPARLDMQHSKKGNIRTKTRIMWVLRDSKSLAATSDRLNLAHSRLMHLSLLPQMREGQERITETYARAGEAPPPYVPHHTSTKRAIAERRKDEKERLMRTTSTNTPEMWSPSPSIRVSDHVGSDVQDWVRSGRPPDGSQRLSPPTREHRDVSPVSALSSRQSTPPGMIGPSNPTRLPADFTISRQSTILASPRPRVSSQTERLPVVAEGTVSSRSQYHATESMPSRLPRYSSSYPSSTMNHIESHLPTSGVSELEAPPITSRDEAWRPEPFRTSEGLDDVPPVQTTTTRDANSYNLFRTETSRTESTLPPYPSNSVRVSESRSLNPSMLLARHSRPAEMPQQQQVRAPYPPSITSLMNELDAQNFPSSGSSSSATPQELQQQQQQQQQSQSRALTRVPSDPFRDPDPEDLLPISHHHHFHHHDNNNPSVTASVVNKDGLANTQRSLAGHREPVEVRWKPYMDNDDSVGNNHYQQNIPLPPPAPPPPLPPPAGSSHVPYSERSNRSRTAPFSASSSSTYTSHGGGIPPLPRGNWDSDGRWSSAPGPITTYGGEDILTDRVMTGGRGLPPPQANKNQQRFYQAYQPYRPR